MHENLEVLKCIYLTHRQNGACEATYRLLKNMHLKDSNITTVFLTTGFPENRYQFLKWTDGEDCLKDTVRYRTCGHKSFKRCIANDQSCLILSVWQSLWPTTHLTRKTKIYPKAISCKLLSSCPFYKIET